MEYYYSTQGKWEFRIRIRISLVLLVLLDLRQGGVQGPLHVLRHVVSLRAQLQRRLYQSGPGQLAESLVSHVVAHRLPGHGDAQWALVGLLRLLVKHVHLGGVRSHFPGVNGRGVALASIVNVHQEAATDSHALDGQEAITKERRYRRIHSAAVLLKDVPEKVSRNL